MQPIGAFVVLEVQLREPLDCFLITRCQLELYPVLQVLTTFPNMALFMSLHKSRSNSLVAYFLMSLLSSMYLAIHVFCLNDMVQ